jgi:15-cis-phytoene synthase
VTLATETPATANYAECEARVRAGDYDRWLATAFVPADKRRHIHALLAFSLEIARVREIISEPRLGEIRLQWWREALEGERAEAGSHPVAAALLDTRRRFNLPEAPFLALIEAREFDLWNDPAPSLAWLEGYCGETASSLFRLAALILAEGREPGGVDAAGHAGVAWAITGLLRALPWHARAGRVYVPSDLLAAHGVDPADVVACRASRGLRDALADLRGHARKHMVQTRRALRDLAPPARPALAALALVEPYLKRMERPDYDPFATTIDLPPWRKVARLWLRGGG